MGNFNDETVLSTFDQILHEITGIYFLIIVWNFKFQRKNNSTRCFFTIIVAQWASLIKKLPNYVMGINGDVKYKIFFKI